MRNWNYVMKNFEYPVGTPIASLPMRNWNPEMEPEEPKEIENCQPTYEELKHIIIYKYIFI